MRGEEALHHSVVPRPALGGHAGCELVLSEQVAVVDGPGLSVLLFVDQKLLSVDL